MLTAPRVMRASSFGPSSPCLIVTTTFVYWLSGPVRKAASSATGAAMTTRRGQESRAAAHRPIWRRRPIKKRGNAQQLDDLILPDFLFRTGLQCASWPITRRRCEQSPSVTGHKSWSRQAMVVGPRFLRCLARLIIRVPLRASDTEARTCAA